MKNLAILGGEPIFKKYLPFVKPDFPEWKLVKPLFKNIFKETVFTKGKYLEEFEYQIEKELGVRNAICVSSCTSGLMLVLKALGIKGEVILPSFTFFATGQALMWMKDIKPVFVDIDPYTFNIDPIEARKAITSNTSAIIGVNVFGNPLDIYNLENIAKYHNVKLIFDSAHCFGSFYNSKKMGNGGTAEVFSCSPTKLLIAGEGGIITTNDDELAEKINILKEYGDSSNVGMNARMSEFNAAMGLASLKKLKNTSKKRRNYAKYILKKLRNIKGIKTQRVHSINKSSYKDFTIVIEESFGITRDELIKVLKLENIQTKIYYDPPLHLMESYKEYTKSLPVTEKLCQNILTLPLSSSFSIREIKKMCKVIKNISKNGKEIKEKLNG